ncbi:hypothetical protein GEMRC1_003105 [Eukaryota sp. GEM-RC1]
MRFSHSKRSFFLPVTLSYLRDSIGTPFAGQLFLYLIYSFSDHPSRYFKSALQPVARQISPPSHSITTPLKGSAKRRIVSTINTFFDKNPEGSIYNDLSFMSTGPLTHAYLSYMTFSAIKEATFAEQKPDTVISTLFEEQVYVPYKLLSYSTYWKTCTTDYGISADDSVSAGLITELMMMDVQRRGDLHYSNTDRIFNIKTLGIQSLTLPLARMLLSHYFLDLLRTLDFPALETLSYNDSDEFCFSVCSWLIPLIRSEIDQLFKAQKLLGTQLRFIFFRCIGFLSTVIKSMSGLDSLLRESFSLVGFDIEFREIVEGTRDLLTDYSQFYLTTGHCYSVEEAELFSKSLSKIFGAIYDVEREMLVQFLDKLKNHIVHFGDVLDCIQRF